MGLGTALGEYLGTLGSKDGLLEGPEDFHSLKRLYKACRRPIHTTRQSIKRSLIISEEDKGDFQRT
jgi:hypothetical protein